jgi:hypothetical protein
MGANGYEPLHKRAYEYALSAFYMNELESVIEFFPDDAGELLRYFSDVISCTGVDHQENISAVKEKYPEAIWVEYGKTQAKYDMVLSFDPAFLNRTNMNRFAAEVLRHGPKMVIVTTPYKNDMVDDMADLFHGRFDIHDVPLAPGGISWLKVIHHPGMVLPY